MVFLLYVTFSSSWILAFYIFPILGIIFSIGSLKDLFKTKNNLLNKFCNITSFSDCNTVVNSSKWVIFEKINFSDLSITFFVTQAITLLLIGITNDYNSYFLIQISLLFTSIPIILLSIYYQKFVEKKWCPICLSIITIIIIEMFYIILFRDNLFKQIKALSVFIYLFVGLSSLLTWSFLKKHLKTVNSLKEKELKNNQFKRNYFVFKNTLIAKSKYDIPQNSIFSSKESITLNIDIITSPFCNFCEEPHFMLQEITKKHGDNINIRLIYNFNIKESKDINSITLHRNLLFLKQQFGNDRFNTAVSEWYLTKDIHKWINKHNYEFNTDTIDLVLDSQYKWCLENKFNFTPCLFINGYKFPDAYNVLDLKFFLEEMINDNSLT